MSIRSVAALVAATAFGCQGAPDPVGSVKASVLGGVDDTTHEQVVSLATLPSAPLPELCTGVVVGPRVILTAGHCVRGQTPKTLQVGIGPSAAAPTRTVAIESVAVMPRFSGDLSVDRPEGRDLGVVLLAEDAGVTPLAIAHAPASGGAKLVGYGVSSTTDVETRGTRRIADVTLGDACALLVAFGDGTTNACHGDSGAPLLHARSDGTAEVVGIVSYGRTAACDPPTYAVRVDAYAGWIESVIAGGATDDCAKCPAEAIDCPPGRAPDAGAETDAPAAAPSETAGGGSCALHAPRSGGFGLCLIMLALLRRRIPGGARPEPPRGRRGASF